MRYRAGWGSHIPMLVACVQASEGPVLELGLGPFSTPVLHWLCLDRRRRLVSYDDSEAWVELHWSFRSDLHSISSVDDWDSVDLSGRWGVAFVDNAPAESRAGLVRRLADHADFVVVHDADETHANPDPYGYDFSGFRFRYDYRPARPYTTVLSNVVDVVAAMRGRI